MKKKRVKKSSKKPLLRSDNTQYPPSHQLKSTRELTFWLAMLILISCNFLISIILIPFLIVAQSVFIYFITLIMGLMIGSIFTLVIKDLEDVQDHHHAVALVFVPLIAVMNIVIIVNLSYSLAEKLSLGIYMDPWNLGMVYGVALLVPMILSYVRSKLFKQS